MCVECWKLHSLFKALWQCIGTACKTCKMQPVSLITVSHCPTTLYNADHRRNAHKSSYIVSLWLSSCWQLPSGTLLTLCSSEWRQFTIHCLHTADLHNWEHIMANNGKKVQHLHNYSVSRKNPPPRGPDIFSFFHKRLRICNRFFTYLLNVPMLCSYVPSLDYTFLFNYHQFWRNYAILSATTKFT